MYRPTARHQNAAVVILQPVLITQSVGRHTAAYSLNIILLGMPRMAKHYVIVLAKGTTIRFGRCLDLGHSRHPEYDLFYCRVNNNSPLMETPLGLP